MADNFGTLTPTTDSTSNDQYLLRQNGIDYKQSRETLAAGVANARWIATADYFKDSKVIGSNGISYRAVTNSGTGFGGAVDPISDTAEVSWEVDVPTVTPMNNQWNGFFTVDHLNPLPSPAGLPQTSGSGGTDYSDGEEWTVGNYATGGNISLDDDGVIFSLGTYKLFTYTVEQLALVDVADVPVYIFGQDGSRHFVKHNGTSVVVTKPNTTTLKVQINNAILAELGITKMFYFFATNSVGFIPPLSPANTVNLLISSGNVKLIPVDVTTSRTSGVTYTNSNDYPITVSVAAVTTLDVDGYAAVSGVVDGVSVSSNTATSRGNNVKSNIVFNVPSKSNYSFVLTSGVKSSIIEYRLK